MGYSVELADHCRRGNALETFIPIGRYVCACQFGERPVAYGAAQYRVDSRRLGHGTTLARSHLSAIARQKLSERGFLCSASVCDPSRSVGFRLKVTRPAQCRSFGIERLGARGNTSTANLRLPAPSEFSDC